MAELKEGLVCQVVRGLRMAAPGRFLLLAMISWQVLWGSFAFGVAQHGTEQRGKIKFLNRLINFGRVMRGEELTYRFHFKNIGQGPLRIQGVHAACGCTIAEVSSHKVYEPGESAYIDLTFKTENFVGPVTKAITVMTNERLAPNRTLSVRAHVMAEFMADPPLVDFGDVDDATSPKRQINITPVNNFPLDIKSLSYNEQLLEVTYRKKEGHHWLLEVGLKPFKQTGFLKETILVNNNSKTLPQLKLVVRANLQGPIRYEPAYLEFGAIAKEGQAKRLINLQAKGPFAIKKSWLEISLNGQAIANPSRYFTINSPEQAGNHKDVEFTLHNLAERSGSIHGKLFLETSDQVQNQIVLDFYGFFL